jgi:hypothetical protein
LLKTFTVPSSYVDMLRASAVRERLASMYPDSPLVVDVTKAADQFGLRASHFPDLLGNIIPGNDGTCP